MKEKSCKCGHMHKYSKWSGIKHICEHCECQMFVSTDFPKRIDKISFGIFFIGLGIVCLLMFIAASLFHLAANDPSEKLDEKILTMRHVVSVMFVFCVVLGMWFGGMMWDEYKMYRRKKRRKSI